MANTSFAALKRNSKANLENMRKESSKLVAKTTYEDDDRYWKPTVDKAGNGSAVIRFLPPSQGEDVAFVRQYKHAFKGPGGSWYIEDSLTTLNQQDPVSDYNSKLWSTGLESNKNIARNQKRKQVFTSGVYIVSDPAKPECEGKVFLYEYGSKIFDKLSESMHPVDDGDEPMNPFDLFEGANFKLRIRNVEVDQGGRKVKFRNYDKSQLMEQGPLLDDEEEMEAIWNKQYPLMPLIDPSKFKTYEQLKARLDKVLGLGSDETTEFPKSTTPYDEDSANPNFSKREDPVEKKSKKAPVVVEEDDEETIVSEPDTSGDEEDDSDEDSGLAFFRGLAAKSKK